MRKAQHHFHQAEEARAGNRFSPPMWNRRGDDAENRHRYCLRSWVATHELKPHMTQMPKRVRSHILEEESIRRFEDSLPSQWVYRTKSPDYGIDGEVEIYNEDGSATGLTFHVQLRGTDASARADRVRLKVDQLDYLLSFDVPAIVVRYDSSDCSFNWEWATKISSVVKVGEQQKSFTFRYGQKNRWYEATPAEIRRTLEVRRRLLSYPAATAVPLRVDLSAIPASSRYPIDRAIAQAILNSRGALSRAGISPGEIEAFAKLEPCFLTVGIDSVTGATFDLREPATDEYIASILYGLARIFARQRLLRQAEGIATLLIDLGLAHHDADLAFDACLTLARDLTKLVQLAIVNGFHDQGSPLYAAVSLAIVKAPQGEIARRNAFDAFFEASIAAARSVSREREAAAYYTIGNFYRARSEFARAVFHYNRARKLRPAYMRTAYFLAELGGVLFLAGRYQASARMYWEAALRDAGESDVVFLLADALMLAGFVAAARSCFHQTITSCKVPQKILEAELKIMICDHLAETIGQVVPRRRLEANLALSSVEEATPSFFEALSREIDAINPVARFGLGVARAAESDREGALLNFLLCTTAQPSDIDAWANAIICAFSLRNATLLTAIMSSAIFHMGTEAYDHVREQLVAQSIDAEALACLDEVAMTLLNENERGGKGGITVRILEGDGYQELIASDR